MALPFVRPISNNDCETCCDDAFPDELTEAQSCKSLGCLRQDSGGQPCSLLADENINDTSRVGCEVGRDLRFGGSTALLSVVGELNSCTPGGQLQQVEIEPPQEISFDVDSCRSCCVRLTQTVDGGGNNPDDVDQNTCQNSCSTSELCFDQPQHTQRLGCLVALDFLTIGKTILHDNEEYRCTVDGDIIGPFTPEEPVSPGNSPVPSPVEIPADSPVPSPSTFVTPTVSPNGTGEVVPASGGVLVAGLVSGLVVSILVIAAFIYGKRVKAKEADFFTNGSTYSGGHKDSATNIGVTVHNDTPYLGSLGSFHSADKHHTLHGEWDTGITVNVDIPASELNREGFTLSKIIPALKGHTADILASQGSVFSGDRSTQAGSVVSNPRSVLPEF